MSLTRGIYNMRTFEIVVRQTEEIKDIFCNMCGEKIYVNEFGQMQDFLQIKKEWSYHSLHDGETHEFDICILCYENIIKQFKIK